MTPVLESQTPKPALHIIPVHIIQYKSMKNRKLATLVSVNRTCTYVELSGRLTAIRMGTEPVQTEEKCGLFRCNYPHSGGFGPTKNVQR